MTLTRYTSFLWSTCTISSLREFFVILMVKLCGVLFGMVYCACVVAIIYALGHLQHGIQGWINLTWEDSSVGDCYVRELTVSVWCCSGQYTSIIQDIKALIQHLYPSNNMSCLTYIGLPMAKNYNNYFKTSFTLCK